MKDLKGKEGTLTVSLLFSVKERGEGATGLTVRLFG